MFEMEPGETPAVEADTETKRLPEWRGVEKYICLNSSVQEQDEF